MVFTISNVREATPNPTRLLFDAILEDDVEALKIALRSGANINDRDEARMPALHRAVFRHHEMFDAVLAAKPDLNALDSMGRTALCYAVALLDRLAERNCMALIAAGADLSITDEDGLTAGDVALICKEMRLVKAIEARLAVDLQQQLEGDTSPAISPSRRQGRL
jgi:ankyrin repeat protein